ncbi:hypothetical protein SAMN05421823_102519 [Catalinimonas alkaloidigena]|uniref:Uncharacterized protein n=1 Tax=Catalinimonas alkaloidigena TaxID=1075417 RepID=A0A1G9B5K8_9BACT|nr:hypothetical protein [Catalinimonas alkaloidigena]SDK34773.1 hypothetical protein SAMN05421823_102519 [Catalinimonas alkaloidigena]
MNQVYFNKRSYAIAGSFQELTRRQLVAIAGIIHSQRPMLDAALRVLFILLQVHRRPRLAWLLYFRLRTHHVQDLLLLTDFLFQKNDLTKNRIPTIRRGLKRLYGPNDELKGLRFIEWMHAEAAFLAYSKTQEEQHLNRLVAILYRPRKKGARPQAPDWDGDLRERYNDYTLEARTRNVSRLPLATRQAILMFYVGCRALIIARFPNVFKEPGESTQVTSGQNGWPEVMRRLAGDVTKFEEVSYQRLTLVLYDLDGRIRDDQALKEKLKQ